VARPPDVERRRALLDALIDAFADGGIGDRPLREIAEAKMKDLNANDIEAAAKIIEGSARAMGLEVTGN
jgi:ribosomal protein L11